MVRPALAATRKPVPGLEKTAPRRVGVEEISGQEVGIGEGVGDSVPVDLATQAAERAIGSGDSSSTDSGAECVARGCDGGGSWCWRIRR